MKFQPTHSFTGYNCLEDNYDHPFTGLLCQLVQRTGTAKSGFNGIVAVKPDEWIAASKIGNQGPRMTDAEWHAHGWGMSMAYGLAEWPEGCYLLEVNIEDELCEF